MMEDPTEVHTGAWQDKMQEQKEQQEAKAKQKVNGKGGNPAAKTKAGQSMARQKHGESMVAATARQKIQ